MSHIFYEPKSKQWVELTDEEAATPEAQAYNPIPYTSEEETKGIWPAMGVRKTQEGVLDAMPFRVPKGGAFTNIHAARAFKDVHPEAGEIEARVYDPTKKHELDWEFQPLSQVETRHKTGDFIATKGSIGAGVPFYENQKDAIQKQVAQKVKEGGFGVKDTAKAAGYNFLEGVSPFAGAIEAFPDARRTLDVERAYRDIDTPEYNADPYYVRTALGTVLPQIAGAATPTLATGGASALGQAVSKKLGAKAVESAATKSPGLLSKGFKLATDPTRTGLGAIGSQVAEYAPRVAKFGEKTPPMLRSLVRFGKPVATNAISASGDTALSEAVAGKARGEDRPISFSNLGVSAVLGGALGVPSGIRAAKAANSINNIRGEEATIKALEQSKSDDPNTADLLDRFGSTIEEAAKLKLAQERRLTPREGFQELGLHKPSDIEGRLKAYERDIANTEAVAQNEAVNTIPTIQRGLRKDIPEFTKAATEKQMHNYTRTPDEQGLMSNYQDTPEMVYDFANTLANTLDQPGAGRTRSDIEREVSSFVQEEGLVSPQQKLQKATGIPFEEPSLRAAISPLEGQGGVVPKTIPTRARNPQVQVPPAPFANPSKTIDQSFMPQNTVFEQLADETPLEGHRLRPDIPEEQWAAKRVGIPNKRTAALAEAVLRKQQQNMPEQFPVAAPLPTTGRVGGIPVPNDPVMGSRYGDKGLSPTYPSKDAGSFSAVPERSYSEADFVPYEKLHGLNMLGNKAWAERQTTRQTPYEVVAYDAVRKATRQILSRAFGSEWEQPQEAKKLALDLNDALMEALEIRQGTKARNVKLNVVTDAPKIVNLIKAMQKMANKVDSDVGDPDKAYIKARQLEEARNALKQTGLDTLEASIDIPGKTTAVSVDPAQALDAFNTKLGDHLNKIQEAVKKADSMSTDESYKKLHDIVRGDWKVLEELMSNVRQNDLNEMGQIMREYVMWNSFISNIPGLGTVGKTIGSLQMLSHGFKMLGRDKTHVRSSMLDNYVVSKNSQKIIERITKGLEDVEVEVDKVIRLRGLRQLGRTGTSGRDRGEDVDRNELSPKSRALVEALESSMQQEPVTAAVEPVKNKIDTEAERIVSSPPEQQAEEFTKMTESGQFTEEEIDQIAEKLEQYAPESP